MGMAAHKAGQPGKISRKTRANLPNSLQFLPLARQNHPYDPARLAAFPANLAASSPWRGKFYTFAKVKKGVLA